LTLFLGEGNPLRYERLSLYRVTLPEPVSEAHHAWEVTVDLGFVARRWTPRRFEPESWLSSRDARLGGRPEHVAGNRCMYVELVASAAATLTLRNTRSGTAFLFDLADVEPGKELVPRNSSDSSARVEVVEREKTWLHGAVIDRSTQRPTPVR